MLARSNRPVDVPYRESCIIWLEDIDQLDYVREAWFLTSGHLGEPTQDEAPPRARVVGYAVILLSTMRNAPPLFWRRVFYLRDYDRDTTPEPFDMTAPHIAVDPRTVAANVCGLLTERALGRPLHESPNPPLRDGELAE